MRCTRWIQWMNCEIDSKEAWPRRGHWKWPIATRLSWYLHSGPRLTKIGYQQRTLVRLTRNDKLVRFQTRGWPDRFRGNETTIFLNDEVVSSGVDDSHTGFKGRTNHQKGNLVQILARKCNPIKEPSQRIFYGGYETMTRCIAFGNPVASRYAQSNNITSEQQKSDNEVHSALTVSNSQ
jgi:hypothetical protein